MGNEAIKKIYNDFKDRIIRDFLNFISATTEEDIIYHGIKACESASHFPEHLAWRFRGHSHTIPFTNILIPIGNNKGEYIGVLKNKWSDYKIIKYVALASKHVKVVHNKDIQKVWDGEIAPETSLGSVYVPVGFKILTITIENKIYDVSEALRRVVIGLHDIVIQLIFNAYNNESVY